jgi:hypothetical protein
VDHVAPTWTDDQVDDIVMGSGAEVWPWYVSGIGQVVHSPGVFGEYVVELGLEENDAHPPTEFRFTRDRFREVAAELAEGKHGTRWDIRDMIRRDDLDADAVDVVIQVIAYGEVIFG